MAQFRRLADEEVAAMQRPPRNTDGNQRKALLDAYMQHLNQFAIGDWVEVSLEEGEKRETVKNRLKRAADRLGKTLMFKRTRGNSLRFQIAEPA
jgi:hypothetical protein